MRPIAETVLWAVYTPGGEDAHGNPGDGWAPPTTVGVWAFDPGGSVEVVGGQDRVITTPSLFMPPEVVFGPRDRVTARGLLYEVDGDTAQWINPWHGDLRGNTVALKRVVG